MKFEALSHTKLFIKAVDTCWQNILTLVDDRIYYTTKENSITCWKYKLLPRIYVHFRIWPTDIVINTNVPAVTLGAQYQKHLTLKKWCTGSRIIWYCSYHIEIFCLIFMSMPFFLSLPNLNLFNKSLNLFNKTDSAVNIELLLIWHFIYFWRDEASF